LAERRGRAGNATIAAVDPRLAYELFLSQLHIQADETKFKQAEKPLTIEEAERLSMVFGGLIDRIMNPFTFGPLGSTVSPRFGKDIISSRLRIVIDILFTSLRKSARDLVEEIYAAKQIRAEEISRKIENLARTLEVSLSAVEDAMNRLMTLAHINLPPELRPSLANVRIGYEIIRGRE